MLFVFTAAKTVKAVIIRKNKDTPPFISMPLQHRAMVPAADWAHFHKELHVVGGAEKVRSPIRLCAACAVNNAALGWWPPGPLLLAGMKWERE